jgi:cbb3-type cytochrome oxidase subunit 1
MFVDLTAAGLVQGFYWRDLAQWEKSVIASQPFWHARSIAGLFIVSGLLLQAFNMWMTARSPARTEPTDQVGKLADAGAGGRS